MLTRQDSGSNCGGGHPYPRSSRPVGLLLPHSPSAGGLVYTPHHRHFFQPLHSFSSAGPSGGRESGPVWMVGGPDQEEHLHLQLIVAPLLAPRVPATWRRFHLLHYRTCGATPRYALTLSNSFSTMPQLNDLSLSHCLFIMTTLLAENAQPRKQV